jgi:hypothetical protein
MKRTVWGSVLGGHVALAAACTMSLLPASAIHAQDTIRVNSNAAPLWGPSIKLTLTKELGLADGPDEYSFGSLSGIVFDKAGRMYTYDEQDKKIRHYDASLKFVREIGRSGSGPGEYEAVRGMTIVNDSVLAFKDHENSRVSFFYPSGKLRNSVTHAAFSGAAQSDFSADNEGISSARTLRIDPTFYRTPSDRMRLWQVKRIRANGTLIDTLPIPPILPYADGLFNIPGWGGGYNFPMSSVAVTKGGGFVFGDGTTYRFMIRSANGSVRIVERPWTPIALGRDERENWRAFGQYVSNRARPAGTDKSPREPIVPTTKPAYKEIFSDEDDRLWVSVTQPARKVVLPPAPPAKDGRPPFVWRQNETYDVFSNQGIYYGRVALPDGIVMGRAKGNRIWVVTRGPSDEQVIRIYTMTGNAALKP